MVPRRVATLGVLALPIVVVAIACGREIANVPDPPFADSGSSGDTVVPPVDASGCRDARWTNPYPTIVPRALTLDPGGRLYAAGNDGNEVWVAELDRCSGATVRERRFAPDARRATGMALLATESELLLAGKAGNGGAENEAGLFFRLDKDLGEVHRQFITGEGWSDLNRIAVGPDGAVWLGGVVEIFGGSAKQKGWVVVRTGDAGCQTKLGQAVAGLGILPDGRALVALQTDAGTTALAELNRCALVRMTAVPVPAAVGGPGDLVRQDSDLFVVGSMDGYGTNKGWVGGRRGDAGWAFAEPVDPNAESDTMVRVATDGDALFTAGNQNSTWTTATPTVYRYALPLLSGARPVWTGLAFGADLHAISDLKAGPKDDEGLYVAGTATAGRTGGAIARCRKATGCGP